MTEQENELPVPVGIPFAGPDPEYVCQRRAEYPPLIDYIDGIVKGDPAQVDAYIAACRAVKAKYPKE